MSCARIRGIVNDLEKEYGEEIAFDQLEATKPEYAKIVKASGLGSHGALAMDMSGKVIWKIPGHRMGREALLEGLKVIRDSKHHEGSHND